MEISHPDVCLEFALTEELRQTRSYLVQVCSKCCVSVKGGGEQRAAIHGSRVPSSFHSSPGDCLALARGNHRPATARRGQTVCCAGTLRCEAALKTFTSTQYVNTCGRCHARQLQCLRRPQPAAYARAPAEVSD